MSLLQSLLQPKLTPSTNTLSQQVAKPTVGVQAKAPLTPPVTNTLPSNQVKTASKTTSASSTANGTGATPLVGGKTFAQASQGITDRAQLGALATQYQNAGSQTPSTTATTASTSPATTPAPQNTTQSPYTVNNGLYGKLVTGLANSPQNSPQYKDAQAAYQKDIGDYNKSVQNEAGALAGEANRAIPLQFVQGRQQVLQSQYAQQQAGLGGLVSGAASALGAANTNQGLTQQALGQAAGLAAPQFPGYTSAEFNPASGTYGTVGEGQYGSGPEAVSNIQSIQDAQTGINNIQKDSPAIDNQFSAIANYAQQAGLTGNSPILAGFQNRFGSNFATDPAVIGFNQAISSLNQLLQAQGEAPIDPNSATMQTIQQAQQTVKSDLARKQSSYQDYLSKGSSSGGKTGGAIFGSFFGN